MYLKSCEESVLAENCDTSSEHLPEAQREREKGEISSQQEQDGRFEKQFN